MKSFQELQSMIARGIGELDLACVPRLGTPIRYALQAPGKYLRPMLTLLVYQLFRSDLPRACMPAIAVQIFHDFTLVHDDIMDQSGFRRGRPALHKKFGISTALLAGDALLALSYRIMNNLQDPRGRGILEEFCEMTLRVCEGQKMDISLGMNHLDEKDSLNLARLKTGALFGFSLKLGGMLGGAKQKDLESLQEAGELLGISFQLRDDMLDIWDDRGELGRGTGEDIKNEKISFAFIQASAQASPAQNVRLQSIVGGKGMEHERKKVMLKELFDEMGIREVIQSRRREYGDRVFELLNTLPSKNEGHQALIDLVKKYL